MFGWWLCALAWGADVAETEMDAGPSADMGVLLPALRRTEQGQGEAAVRLGGAVVLAPGAGGFSPGGAGMLAVPSLRAGFAPIDRGWVELRTGVAVLPSEGMTGVNLNTLTVNYALVDGPTFRTGPSLSGAFAASWDGGDIDGTAWYGAPGWSMAASSGVFTFDASAVVLIGGEEAVGVLPYWELGLSIAPKHSPHSVRIGLATVAPTVAYRYQQRHWFVMAQASTALLVSEAGIEVGARW